MEDLDGLEVAWNWFVGRVMDIGAVLADAWDWIETWPLPVRLVAAGAAGILILLGVIKK